MASTSLVAPTTTNTTSTTTSTSVLERWSAVVERHGASPALSSPGTRRTFTEVDRRSTAMARALVEGLDAGSGPIGVLAPQDADAAVAVLAVVKTGRPVVVLDLQLPPARLHRIAELAGLVGCVVAGSARTEARALPEDCPTFDDAALAASASTVSLPCPGSGRDPAAVIFTSGSTGAPKGVVYSHDMLTASADHLRERDGLTPLDRLAIEFAVSFAAGFTALFDALLNGCGVWFFDARSRGARGLPGWIAEHGLTHLSGTPHLLRALQSAVPAGEVLSTVRVVTSGGEPMFARDLVALRRLVPSSTRYVNRLGSSETAGIASAVFASDDPLPTGALPAGRPEPHVSVTVRRPDGGLADTDEAGEVHITSAVLTPGYWGDPERTADRFAPEAGGRRTYRTGDLGRFDAEGRLHLLGRVDGSVKVRGYLVALLEVEGALLTLPAVAEAAVLARPTADGGSKLVAYLTPRPDALLDSAAAVRRRVRELLPEYMVPTSVVVLQDMPRTERGKIDRTALPDIPVVRGSRSPATGLETEVAELLGRVLGLEDVAGDDDLMELGADSLDVEELLAGAEERWGRRLTTAELLAAPTPQALAGLLRPGASALPAHPTLVTLRHGGAETPLFCFAGGGALAMSFRGIAAHVHDRPVHAFQSAGSERRALPDRSVPRAAERHLELVRVLQPRGPYLLVGHSFGGLVALEVARRLTAAGEEVGLVGLIDTYLPSTMRPATTAPEATGVTAPGVTGAWARLSRAVLPDGVPRLRDVPVRARTLLAGLVRFSGRTQTETMFNHAQWVARRYVVPPFAGRAVVVHATGNPDGHAPWEPLLTGPHEFFDVACDHNSLLREPFAVDVAGHLLAAVPTPAR